MWMIGVYLKNGLPLVLLIPFVLMLYCRGRRRCRRFFSLLLWSARFYRFVSYRIVAYYSGGSSSSMFLLLLLYDTQAHSLDDEMNWISHSAVNANYFPSRSFNLHEINHHTSITNKRTTGTHTHTHTYAYPQAYIGQMKCAQANSNPLLFFVRIFVPFYLQFRNTHLILPSTDVCTPACVWVLVCRVFVIDSH